MLVFVTAQQKQNQLEGPRAPGEPGSGDQPNTTLRKTLSNTTTLRDTLSKHCKNHSQAAKQEQTSSRARGPAPKHCKNHSQAAKQEQTKLKEPRTPGARAPSKIRAQATKPFAQNK